MGGETVQREHNLPAHSLLRQSLEQQGIISGPDAPPEKKEKSRKRPKNEDGKSEFMSMRMSTRRSDRPNDCIWHTYHDAQKWELVRILHDYTGYLYESIFRKCRKRFLSFMKEELLSGDESRIMLVKDALFPISAMNFKTQTWMQYINMEQSRIVVSKMARASGKDVEHVRNFFLNAPLDPDMAVDILHADDDACRQYALRLGLDKENSKLIRVGHKTTVSKTTTVWPWMKGLEASERVKVIERLMEATGWTEEQCHELLRQPNAQVKNLGFKLLRVSKGDLLFTVLTLQQGITPVVDARYKKKRVLFPS
ncbi:hypothetical protein CBS101457_000142 [Exobasidium rhododendri]|nr:hypothetical protein CBS101457_000142 [Exobasidium rhododendri]